MFILALLYETVLISSLSPKAVTCERNILQRLNSCKFHNVPFWAVTCSVTWRTRPHKWCMDENAGSTAKKCVRCQSQLSSFFRHISVFQAFSVGALFCISFQLYKYNPLHLLQLKATVYRCFTDCILILWDKYHLFIFIGMKANISHFVN